MLPAVGRMKLPASVMSALYEQVVVELLECREVELAREMLRAAPPLQLLRASDPERWVGWGGWWGFAKVVADGWEQPSGGPAAFAHNHSAHRMLGL